MFRKRISNNEVQVRKPVVESIKLIKTKHFHESKILKAKVTAIWDYNTMSRNIISNKQKVSLNKKLDFSNEIRLNGEYIEKIKKEAEKSNAVLNEIAKKSYMISKETYYMSLRHDCFYDVIDIKEGIYTVAYVPFSTSKNIVFCGIQQFDKIAISSSFNKYINFYTIRIIFHKKMTEKEFLKWEADRKSRYQDMQLRKMLFNNIQKDLEENNYSLLREEDLHESNIEFFTKELPLIKFKFTNFED